MTDTSLHIPRTIMEVYDMLPEGTLAEVIDDRLYISPGLTVSHQRLSRNLVCGMHTFVLEKACGEIFIGPVSVYLDERSTVLQPDILLVDSDNGGWEDEKGLHGVPNLIIEILSPGNKKHDLITKKALYEKFGVKEYWIVDPVTKAVVGYQYERDHYVPLETSPGEIRSPLLHQTFTF